jgi:hypothetical protein
MNTRLTNELELIENGDTKKLVGTYEILLDVDELKAVMKAEARVRFAADLEELGRRFAGHALFACRIIATSEASMSKEMLGATGLGVHINCSIGVAIKKDCPESVADMARSQSFFDGLSNEFMEFLKSLGAKYFENVEQQGYAEHYVKHCRPDLAPKLFGPEGRMHRVHSEHLADKIDTTGLSDEEIYQKSVEALKVAVEEMRPRNAELAGMLDELLAMTPPASNADN